MESEFLVFKEYKDQEGKPRKTKIWWVKSKKDITITLGHIFFYPAWRKFVFAPEDDTIFDNKCLNDISRFCEEETNTWRQNIKRS